MAKPTGLDRKRVLSPRKMTTAQGSGGHARYKNKNKRRNSKKYRGQG